MQHSTTLKRLLILAAAWVVGLLNAEAAVYYVATTGNAAATSTQAQNPTTPARTITQAIGFASDGDAIIIGPGNFGGFSTDKRITIQGSGKGITVCTTTVTLRAAGGSETNRTTLSNLSINRLTGPSNSLLVQQSYVTLNEIYVGGSNRGVYLSYPTGAGQFPAGNYEMKDIVVWDSEIENNTGQGFNFNSGGADNPCDFYNIRIYNSSFSRNSALATTITGGSGLLWTKQNTATNKGGVWDVIVKNCTFSGNLSKGIYAEQLKDALFENITIEGSGFDGSGHAAGIDFNFLGNDYANASNGGDNAFVNGNITFLNCRITGCGWGDNNGAAVIIKARNDNGVRWVDPAKVENIHFKGCVITNNRGGIRFGESNNLLFPGTGVVNTLAGVVKVEYCDFSGNTTGSADIVAHPWSNHPTVTNPQGNRFGIRNFTTASIDAKRNYFGGTSPTVYTQKVATFTGTQTTGSNQITNINVDFTSAEAPLITGKYIYGSFRQADGTGGPTGGNGVIAGDAVSGIGTPSYDQFAVSGTSFTGGTTIANVVNATTLQMSGNATATRQSTFFIYSPQDVMANQGRDISNISTTGSIDATNFLSAPIVRVNGAFEGEFASLDAALATASAGDTILNVPAGSISGVALANNVVLMSPGARLEGNSGTRLTNATVNGNARLGSHLAFDGTLTLNGTLDISGAYVNISGNIAGSGDLKADENTTLIITGGGDLSNLRFANGGNNVGSIRIKRDGKVTLAGDLMTDWLRIDTGVLETGNHTIWVDAPLVQGSNFGPSANVSGTLALNPGMAGLFSLRYPFGRGNYAPIAPTGSVVDEFENVYYTVSADGPTYYSIKPNYTGANNLNRPFADGINRVSFSRYYSVNRSGNANITAAALGLELDSATDFLSSPANLTLARANFTSGSWNVVNSDPMGTPVTSITGEALTTGYYALANIAPGTNLTNAALVISNTPTQFCRDNITDAVNFNIGYSSVGELLPGAVIKAFLTNGGTPVQIGATTANPARDGIIAVQIPANQASASNYRIFLTEELANVVSPDNGTNIVLSVTPDSATISASRPLVFCQGDSVELTAVGDFTSYKWSTGAITQKIKVRNSGTFWVIGTSGAGCIADTSALTTVVVNENPVAPVITSLSGDNSTCAGDSIVLQGPAGFALYAWSNGGSERSTTVKQTANITLQVADGNGCLSPLSTVYHVVVNANPGAPEIMNEGLEACFGDSVSMAGPQGFAAYKWTIGNEVKTSRIIYVKNSGSVSLVVTNDSGCVSPASSVNVTIRSQLSAPLISVKSGASTFCDGDSVVLMGPEGFSSYIWNVNGTELVGDSISVDDSHSVTLQVKDAFGCTSPVSPVLNTVKVAIPSAQVLDHNDTTICAGNTVLLKGPGDFAQYLWSNGETTKNIVVKDAGDYSVQVSNGSDCFSSPSNDVKVSVNPLPEPPSFIFKGNQSFCIGDSVIVKAVTNLDPSVARFIWNGVDKGNVDSAVFYTTSNVLLEVYNSETGCGSGEVATTVTENVIPVATFAVSPLSRDTTICAGETVRLQAAEGFDAYLWSNGNTTPIIDVTETASLSFIAFNGGCASASSDTFNITVRPEFAAPTLTATADVPLTTFETAVAICQGGKVTVKANAANFAGGVAFIVGGDGEERVIFADSVVLDTTEFLTVVGVNEFGCGSIPATLLVSVIEVPTEAPVVSGGGDGDTTLCAGSTLELTAPSGFFNYLWSTGDTTQSIIVSANDTVSVQVANQLKCFGPKSADMIVRFRDQVPAPQIVILEGTQKFCVGDSVVITVPANARAFSWTVNGLPLVGANDTLVIKETATIALVIEDENGCASLSSGDVAFEKIDLPAKPTIGITSGAPSICGGDTTFVEGPEGFSEYFWSNGATGRVVAITQTTELTLIVANETGCLSEPSDNLNIEVRPTPSTPTFTFVGSPNFCDGDSVLVIVNTTGGTGNFEYIWNGVNAGTQDTLWVYGDDTLTVQINDLISGCSSDAVELIITEDPKPAKPTFVVRPTGDTTICAGNSVVLSAPEGFNYRWSNGAVTQSISATEAGTYYFQVANGGCFSENSDSITINLNALPDQPIVEATADTVCPGGTTTLRAPRGFNVYMWSNGLATETITAYADTAYTVMVTDGNGCMSIASEPFTLQFFSAPAKPAIIDTIGNTFFCAGDSVTLVAERAEAYLWSNGAITQAATFRATERVSVVVFNAKGCASVSSDSIDIVVSPLPVATINNTRPLTFCSGDSTVLEGPAGFSYLWSNGANTQNVTVKATDTLSLIVINAGGCSSAPTADVIVTANPLPTAVGIRANKTNTTFCFGDSIILKPTVSTPGVTYRWTSTLGTLVADSIVVRGLVVGAAAVTVTPVLGTCDGPSSAPFGVTVKALPNAGVNISTNGARAQNRGTGLTYEWRTVPAGTLVSSTDSLEAINGGQYTLTVTDTTAGVSCPVTSAPFTITGLTELADAGVSMFPNPASQAVNFELTGVMNSDIVTVSLINAIGVTVKSEVINLTNGHAATNMNLNGVAKGVYLVQFNSGAKRVIRRLTVN